MGKKYDENIHGKAVFCKDAAKSKMKKICPKSTVRLEHIACVTIKWDDET